MQQKKEAVTYLLAWLHRDDGSSCDGCYVVNIPILYNGHVLSIQHYPHITINTIILQRKNKKGIRLGKM